MSGGGSSAPAQPATTTTVQDIPAWEQGYVTNLLGKAETVAAQPYQQFPGQQVAGFTPDQTQAFQNIENAGNPIAANQAQATGQMTAGANSANNIFGTAAPSIQAASGYNPLQAVAPFLGQAQGLNMAAANSATPQGIQNYLNPYTQNVVQGLENTANQNWNQNIMPGVNDTFVGSGQFGSGRNAQVLGQAANQFQTNLNTSVANTLQSGYNTAGQQAATQAGILGQAANTALNTGNAAGTATQQQATNLLNQGTALGQLANTQAGAQVNAGTQLGNLGAQQAQTNFNQNQALQAVGQQQQNLNQTNLNTALNNWTAQVQYPMQQTQYLNQIIRGLPAPSASTSGSQVVGNSVSPLAAIGGTGATLQGLLGSNNSGGQSATPLGAKKGGLIKSYADGGQVDGYDEEDDTNPLSAQNMQIDTDYDEEDDTNPLSAQNMQIDTDYNEEDDTNPLSAQNMQIDTDYNDTSPSSDIPEDDNGLNLLLSKASQEEANNPRMPSNNVSNVPQVQQASAPQNTAQANYNPISEANLRQQQNDKNAGDSTAKQANPLLPSAPPVKQISDSDMQRAQWLALARGLLTPNKTGALEAFGTGIGNVADTTMQIKKMQQQQAQLAYDQEMKRAQLGIQNRREDIAQQRADANDARVQAYTEKQNNPSGKDSVTQWKYNTWLEAHPNDTEGALKFASGQKQPTTTVSNQMAVKMAADDKLQLDPEGKMSTQEKIDAYSSVLNTGKLPNGNALPKKSQGFSSSLFGGNSTPPAVTPPQQAIDYLKAHPETSSHFEQKYGNGTSSKYLGQ